MTYSCIKNIDMRYRDKRKDSTKGVLIEMSYSIIILDIFGKKIGELMTATSDEVIKLMNKGFIVIDRASGISLTEQDVMSAVGVSDGVIDVG